MKIHEIFYSIQGEGFNTGLPSIFVRFQGCNQRCDFCDQGEAQRYEDGKECTVVEVIRTIHTLRRPSSRQAHIVFTGGEPLTQLNAMQLLIKHLPGPVTFEIETSGMPLDKLSRMHEFRMSQWLGRIRITFTLSPHHIGHCSDILQHLYLAPVDQLKLVWDVADLTIVAYELARHSPTQRLYVQPRWNDKPHLEALMVWLKDHHQWKLSLQTHKLIGIR